MSEANGQVQPSRKIPKRPATVTKACMHMRPKPGAPALARRHCCRSRLERENGCLGCTRWPICPSGRRILTGCRIQKQQSGRLYESFRWQTSGSVVQKEPYLVYARCMAVECTSDGVVCWCLMPWQQFESEGYAGFAWWLRQVTWRWCKLFRQL